VLLTMCVLSTLQISSPLVIHKILTTHLQFIPAL
jgi:hypothetical protein